jgi:predicted  nucleic acid-binding Zn-ribbon protein
MDPAVIAVIGTVAGGVALKIIEHWLGRSKVKVDDAARLRDELRLEIAAQREEIKQLETEITKWRNDYYDLRDKYMNLNIELQTALQQIKAEARAAESKVAEIDQQLPPPTP